MNVINPVFIAIDDESFQFIKSLKGQCLFYDQNCKLSFFYQREVWVLYSGVKSFNKALRLGRKIQQAGSKKVLILLINIF